MQAGVIGGICLLAFLLSEGKAEDLESIKESKVIQDVDKLKEALGVRRNGGIEAPSDLKNELNLAVTQSNSRVNEGRSGDIEQNDVHGFGDSAVSNAVAQPSDDGSALRYSESFGGPPQSRAPAIPGASPFNPFNEELGPYISPGSSFSQAEAQAINGDSYGQGPNSYPYSSSYPYTSGLSPAQSQADNGLYPPSPNLNPQADNGFYQRDPIYSPYQGLSSAQAQNQADNGLYQPGYNGLPNVSPYNQGSSLPQMPGQNASESHQSIIEPISMLPKPDPRLNQVPDSHSAYSSSYPYSSRSSSSSAYTQFKDNNEPYQSVPFPNPNFSPYDRFLIPYGGHKSAQTQSNSDTYEIVPKIKPNENRYESYPRPYSQGQNSAYDFASSHSYGQNEPYQAIPLPDPNPSPYDSFLVPYRDPSSPQAQTDNAEYQPIPFPETETKQEESISRLHSDISYSVADYTSSHSLHSAKPQSPDERGSYPAMSIAESRSYDTYKVPYYESTFSHKKNSNGGYQLIPIPSNRLRIKPTPDEINPNQSIPVPNNGPSRYESSMVLNHNIARTRDYIPEEIDSSEDLESKSGWVPFENNPFPPNVPNPQLYPSGAETAQGFPDFKAAASGVVNSYSQGISQFASDYPSELLYRPESYKPAENETQGPINDFPSGQSLQIAFEDAESRPILPFEYVFPNKMPGGENAIQCTKENEFHHFWSKELDCLVCICLNEYGLLSPVCARCAGCHSPPLRPPDPVPRLPESIPVEPATLGPIEPIPIIPEPYPPVPLPEAVPEPPIPSPELPQYSESVPTPAPVPVTFPEPVATLPPPPAQAHCNPLPTGIPFTNPLHPCQICICRESFVTGKTDVQIECKENPQCIAPADVTALPPIPDVPMPIPLPTCEKFPENVLFPHPTETCKLCKCAKSLSEDGIPEQQITCYPHPDCVPKVEMATDTIPPLPLPVDPFQEKPYPEPEPVPIEPLREPFTPMEPVPLPELVTVEPLPWPPITTTVSVPALPVLTPRPGPLPGPSPHESCRPYPPNQTFQHPWDECQICVCTEATAIGMITVEVNCYTKPSCCLDPPDSVKAAFPGNLLLLIGSAIPNSPDIGSQPTTSTYKPSPGYSYSPTSVNVYPVSKQVADPLNQPSVYPTFVEPSSSYPYQPSYAPTYVNPQFSEYPPRLPVLPGTSNTMGQYKPNNFGYPPNYQYGQGDAIGNNYPPQYQPFDPRFQPVPAPAFPGMYQRANYERPPMYAPGQGYVKPPALPGPNPQNMAQSYAGAIGYSKTGRDGSDSDDVQ